jgi:TnpA family transposase
MGNLSTKVRGLHWDEICRLTASLRVGTVVPSAILRTLQRGPSPSSLARALAELGRVIKTLHVLEYVHDPAYRRTIHRLLSQGERRNALARDVFHGQRGQLRKHYQVGQENQLDSLGIMINVIVLWQTVYIQAALDHQRSNCGDTFAICEGIGTGATMIFTKRSPRASLSNGSLPRRSAARGA